MTTKLLALVEKMQGRVQDYLISEGYTDLDGTNSNTSVPQQGLKTREELFIGDMIYCLDGPEQREAQAEASFDYLALSERTASGHFHGNLVDYARFIKKLASFVEAAEELDRYKKIMFYGEDQAKGRISDQRAFDLKGDGELLPMSLVGLDAVAEDLENAEFIIHGILGVATEAGEMAEALVKALTDQGDFDLVNLGEESGDVKWYLAMLARVRGVKWDADERINIAKLQARFPDKFTTELANTRNLEDERTILEGGVILEGDEAVVARAEAALADAESPVEK